MKNPQLQNYYQQHHNNYIVKLRKVEGFDTAKIKDGLLAMDYDLQSLPEGDTLKLFCNGISTCPLVIHRKPNGIDVSLSLFSSPGDWELMRDWLLNFFNFSNAIAIAENDLIEDVELFFNDTKIEEQQILFRELLFAYMHNDELICLPGVYRNFYAGHKVYERIREQPENEHLPYFYDLICKSQYINIQAQVSATGKVNEEFNTTFSLLDNSDDIVLQPADIINITLAPGDTFSISYNSIDKLIRHGWHYLDEKQIFIPRMPDTEWRNFCADARDLSINSVLYSKYIENTEEE